MKLAIPVDRELPLWPVSDQQAWESIAARARRVARRAGAGHRFRDRVVEVRLLLEEDDKPALRSRLTDRLLGRAMLHVWADDAELAARTMRSELVREAVRAQGDRTSRLFLITLASLHLTYFDVVDEWETGLFRAMSDAITARVAAISAPAATLGAADVLAVFRVRPDLVTDPRGPFVIASEAWANNMSLRDWIHQHGLVGSDGGRFGQLLQHAMYIERLRAADPTRADELIFLDDFADRNLLQAPSVGGLMFGHVVVEAMTERADVAPCDRWLAVILEIAGDPRLHHTKEWNDWWRPLPASCADTMRSWLSVEDLKLFLDAVEHFGDVSNSAELKRMFPARKSFLLGLHELGLVRETRLVMGADARQSVSRTLAKVRADISRYASDRRTAVIVVDCGDFFIVEGSHNFKLYTYAGRPHGALMDRRERVFTGDFFKEVLPDQHVDHHPLGADAFESFVHNGLWQGRAIEYLVERLGADIDPSLLLDPEDYNMLRRRRLPIRGARLLR